MTLLNTYDKCLLSIYKYIITHNLKVTDSNVFEGTIYTYIYFYMLYRVIDFMKMFQMFFQ